MPAKGTGKVFKHAFSRTGVIVGAKNVIGLSLAVNYGDFAFLPGYLFGNPLFIHAMSFKPLFTRWSGIGRDFCKVRAELDFFLDDPVSCSDVVVREPSDKSTHPKAEEKPAGKFVKAQLKETHPNVKDKANRKKCKGGKDENGMSTAWFSVFCGWSLGRVQGGGLAAGLVYPEGKGQSVLKELAHITGYPAYPAVGHGAVNLHGSGIEEAFFKHGYVGKSTPAGIKSFSIGIAAFKGLFGWDVTDVLLKEDRTADGSFLSVKQENVGDYTAYYPDKEPQQESQAKIRCKTPKQKLHLNKMIAPVSGEVKLLEVQ